MFRGWEREQICSGNVWCVWDLGRYRCVSPKCVAWAAQAVAGTRLRSATSQPGETLLEWSNPFDKLLPKSLLGNYTGVGNGETKVTVTVRVNEELLDSQRVFVNVCILSGGDR